MGLGAFFEGRELLLVKTSRTVSSWSLVGIPGRPDLRGKPRLRVETSDANSRPCTSLSGLQTGEEAEARGLHSHRAGGVRVAAERGRVPLGGRELLQQRGEAAERKEGRGGGRGGAAGRVRLADGRQGGAGRGDVGQSRASAPAWYFENIRTGCFPKCTVCRKQTSSRFFRAKCTPSCRERRDGDQVHGWGVWGRYIEVAFHAHFAPKRF